MLSFKKFFKRKNALAVTYDQTLHILNNETIFVSFIDSNYVLNLMISSLQYQELYSRKIQLAEVIDIQVSIAEDTIYLAYAGDSDNDILLSVDYFLNTKTKVILENGLATESQLFGTHNGRIHFVKNYPFKDSKTIEFLILNAFTLNKILSLSFFTKELPCLSSLEICDFSSFNQMLIMSTKENILTIDICGNTNVMYIENIMNIYIKDNNSIVLLQQLKEGLNLILVDKELKIKQSKEFKIDLIGTFIFELYIDKVVIVNQNYEFQIIKYTFS